jgi:hypothetical protein
MDSFSLLILFLLIASPLHPLLQARYPAREQHALPPRAFR